MGADVKDLNKMAQRKKHCQANEKEGLLQKQDDKTGSIQFENVTFRYHDNGPIVLNQLTLIIPSKQKVGVIGRTGAGKSSLIAALFRIANIDEDGRGVIRIGGVDTARMSLVDLRGSLSIIPQT